MNNVSAAGYENMIATHRHNRAQLSAELNQYHGVFKRTCLIGCGGVGAWVGFFIAASDMTKELCMFDSDKVELHNHNRFMYPVELTDSYKSVSLAALIKQSRPDMVVRTFERDFEPDLDIKSMLEGTITSLDPIRLGDLDLTPLEQICYPRAFHELAGPHNLWNAFLNSSRPVYVPIIDTTDNPVFQQRLCDEVRSVADTIINKLIATYKHARTEALDVPPVIPVYLRISYNGADHITITSRNGSWGLEQATGRYDVIPSFAMPAILSAAYGIYGLLQTVQKINLDIYRRIQDMMWRHIRPGVRSIDLIQQTQNTISYSISRNRRSFRTHMPWLMFNSASLAQTRMTYSLEQANADHPTLQILNPENGPGEIQELLADHVPSLYPGISFGSSEHWVGIDMDQIKEASNGKEEEVPKK